MALDVGQATTVSYPDVLKDERGAANQWADDTVMATFKEMGFFSSRDFGEIVECPLDYRRNPGGVFLTADLQPMSLVKTEVLTAARYQIGQVSVPVTWSEMDDVKNPSENQKLNRAAELNKNGIATHDEIFEEAIFDGATNFLSLSDLLPTTGLGSPGGISATSELMWRNPNDTYQSDGSDIDAALTEARNSAMKGSNGQAIKLLISGSGPQALWESTQTPMQRFTGSNLNAGFTKLAFKNAVWIFSQYGGTKVFGTSPRHFHFLISKGHFRKQREKTPLEAANGYGFMIYSAAALVTNNKSRGFVVEEA